MGEHEKLICNNKKAFHDYFIEERYEAGMVLQGTEVKSLRNGKANLNDSFAMVKNGEAFLHNFHINPYDFGNRENHDPDRMRKLLLHKKEIVKLFAKIREQGYTLIPLRVYFKEGKVKAELGLAKGKKNYDKREVMKEKDMQRDIAQGLKDRNRGARDRD
ncbi:SsrA-binding protein [Citrifermentans bemidjiense Bem]|uniref:SsrA-binding protein n=1 Tax=Citrifermentans bemidjiense (strain ATCC BAA-1014 / DSM 16622 / JCM 12645 / Bem) TaxID=404380 RepID=B5E842_CITBB|nr:SsrA-binding protein SmpB [Citrifermentans bemidjiense]ACH40011.1 SsrA-binding protein [Citrifermentans bemidjiense Bem]